MNYRGGAEGFLYLGAGLLDQIAALEWVQEDIGVLDGDPRQGQHQRAPGAHWRRCQQPPFLRVRHLEAILPRYSMAMRASGVDRGGINDRLGCLRCVNLTINMIIDIEYAAPAIERRPAMVVPALPPTVVGSSVGAIHSGIVTFKSTA
jgi:hypothetical protein